MAPSSSAAARTTATRGPTRGCHVGLLFQGGPRHISPNYHCAPMPVLDQGGRLYRAFEDNTPCDWPVGFQACVISADVDADLLDAANWTMSNKLPFDLTWCPKSGGTSKEAGWLEGNIVADPKGQLWDILRVNAPPPQATPLQLEQSRAGQGRQRRHYLPSIPAPALSNYPAGTPSSPSATMRRATTISP